MQAAFYLLFLPIIFLFGAAIGSFLNVVILRTHEGKTLGGRSECPYCHHTLATADLIPILSYLFLAGKCRYCDHKLSIQYPLVELLTAVSFTLAFLNLESGTRLPDGQVLNQGVLFLILNSLFMILTISVLIVITVSDLRWGIIPDKVILPAIIVAFVFKSSLFLISNIQNPRSYLFDLATAAGVGLFFLVLILGTKGKGMGGGDLKLSIFIGLALGWPLSILAIFLGFLTGAIGAVMLILLGKKSLKQSVPFGPFLALGAFLAIVYGNRILELYLKSMGF